jgi:hypothetical protein
MFANQELETRVATAIDDQLYLTHKMSPAPRGLAFNMPLEYNQRVFREIFGAEGQFSPQRISLDLENNTVFPLFYRAMHGYTADLREECSNVAALLHFGIKQQVDNYDDIMLREMERGAHMPHGSLGPAKPEHARSMQYTRYGPVSLRRSTSTLMILELVIYIGTLRKPAVPSSSTV